MVSRGQGRPGASRRGLLARWLGTRGERLAARALRKLGLRILARNLRTPCGEVDLLADDRGLLVLVEVKSTGRAGSAPAWERVDGQARQRLTNAGHWLVRQPAFAGRGFRIDLVAVAFGPGQPLVTIRPNAL